MNKKRISYQNHNANSTFNHMHFTYHRTKKKIQEKIQKAHVQYIFICENAWIPAEGYRSHDDSEEADKSLHIASFTNCLKPTSDAFVETRHLDRINEVRMHEIIVHGYPSRVAELGQEYCYRNWYNTLNHLQFKLLCQHDVITTWYPPLPLHCRRHFTYLVVWIFFADQLTSFQ